MLKKMVCLIVSLMCVFSIAMCSIAFAAENALYEENFEDGKADGMTVMPDSGEIKIVDDGGNKMAQLTHNGTGDGYLHVVFGPEATDFIYEMRIKPTYFKTNDWHWGKIGFRTGLTADGQEMGENKSYYIGIWQWRTQLVLKNSETGKGDDNTIAENQDIVFEPNKWYNLKIVAKGNVIDVFVDGEKAFSYTDKDNTLTKGKFAFSGWGAEYMVDDIKITTETSTSAEEIAAPTDNTTTPAPVAETAQNPKTSDAGTVSYVVAAFAGAVGLAAARRKKN